MKKLLLLIAALSMFSTAFLTGCATTGTTAQPSQTQDIATKSVVVMGNILITAPEMLKSARAAGLMTKEQFNSSVDVYNKALASYTLLNKALQSTITAGQDPNAAQSYISALAQYMTDRDNLSAMLLLTGGTK